MAWDWVVPVATSGFGALVGISGIVASFKTSERSRQHAENLAEERHWHELELAKQKSEHDLRLAREQRRQERQAVAYVEILKEVQRVSFWANASHPDGAMEKDDAPKHLHLVTDSAADALLRTYGSDEVIGLFDTWRTRVQEIAKSFHLLTIDLNAGPGSRWQNGKQTSQEWSRLYEKLVPDENTAKIALTKRIQQELQDTG
ncbi:hypothetical protein J5U46_08420 [Micromonospora tulbaghiae]|uniref:Uncharacterized protein n=1 Tax=Micromonospora tulbaghiae TaxID=479978 RepID=A0AAW4JFJ9_9ACTN|nr:hypothetical protein [Micromonospora tulbaghiae]MBO4140164.1 hypothetical protein [Micromonospora tulbaghiae]